MYKLLRIGLVLALLSIAFGMVALSFAPGTLDWYANLAKPVTAPPPLLFASVWTFLYLPMAVALMRIYAAASSDECRRFYFTFGIQFALNVLLSLFFFAFHALFFSLIIVIVLFFAVTILTASASKLDIASFWFLLPYLAWVTFVTVLTVQIWWVN